MKCTVPQLIYGYLDNKRSLPEYLHNSNVIGNRQTLRNKKGLFSVGKLLCTLYIHARKLAIIIMDSAHMQGRSKC